MKAFDKILVLMQGGVVNGHAVANARNIDSLARAKVEIEEAIKNIPK